MNKSETREVERLDLALRAGLCDRATVARALSALVRAARTSKSRAALVGQAEAWGVTSHPEYIV